MAARLCQPLLSLEFVRHRGLVSNSSHFLLGVALVWWICSLHVQYQEYVVGTVLCGFGFEKYYLCVVALAINME